MNETMTDATARAQQILDTLPDGWEPCPWTSEIENLIVDSNMRAVPDNVRVSEIIDGWKSGGMFVNQKAGCWTWFTKHIDKMSMEVHGGKWSDDSVDEPFKALCDWAIDTFGLAVINTYIPDYNKGARALVERVGFKATGKILFAGKRDDEPYHNDIFAYGQF